MGAKQVCVEVRLGKYDCVHLPECQTCVHIEHPLLAEPLDLILADYRSEEFEGCCWDEIVGRALEMWLGSTWLNMDRPRVLSFKELFDRNPQVRADFQRACAVKLLCQCRVQMDRLRQEIDRLQGVVAATERPAESVAGHAA